jgi:hypothetical protein
LRLFGVYVAPVVLKGVLDHELYVNLLDLFVAMRILLSPSLLENYGDFAAKLLTYFVQSFGELYGKDQLVYSIHSLIHLHDDAKKFGMLDSCSAFKYENYLGCLKKLVRRPQAPCAQVVRRILERNGQIGRQSQSKLGFSKPHMEGPITIGLKHCSQYKQYSGTHCFISTSKSDNCFEISGKVGLVRNIVKERISDDVSASESISFGAYVLFEEFIMTEPFFTEPLNSKDIGISFVEKMAGIHKVIPLCEVKAKCMMLPFKNGYVVMPQLHF